MNMTKKNVQKYFEQLVLTAESEKIVFNEMQISRIETIDYIKRAYFDSKDNFIVPSTYINDREVAQKQLFDHNVQMILCNGYETDNQRNPIMRFGGEWISILKVKAYPYYCDLIKMTQTIEEVKDDWIEYEDLYQCQKNLGQAFARTNGGTSLKPKSFRIGENVKLEAAISFMEKLDCFIKFDGKQFRRAKYIDSYLLRYPNVPKIIERCKILLSCFQFENEQTTRKFFQSVQEYFKYRGISRTGVD